MENSKKNIRKTIALLILVLNSFYGTCQYLVSSVLIESKTGPQVTTLLNTIGAGAGLNYAVDTYKIMYNTTDAFNNATIASGACMIPKGTPCDSFPLLSYAHGMVLKKTEVPSQIYNNNIEGYYFSAKGFLVSMPDYLGLGSNAGFHPFQHAKTEATASLDLMRAVKEFVLTLSNTYLTGKVFITGYSQGGHAAMATVKYIQDNNLYSTFNVVAAAPASGAYSMSQAQTRTMAGTYSYNGFIPYVVNSYQNVYTNLYTNPNQYYTNPFDVNIPPYMNGATTFNTFNTTLPTNVTGFMQGALLSAFMPDTVTFSHPLRQDLRLNDNYSWKPTRPLKLCYCTADDAINYGNSIMAYDTMIAKGSTSVTKIDVSPTSNHYFCTFAALTYIRTWFNTYRSDCNLATGVLSDFYSGKTTFQVYPNPTEDLVRITSDKPIENIQMFDINGREVFNKTILGELNTEINISDLNNGVYFLKLNKDQQPIKIVLIK